MRERIRVVDIESDIAVLTRLEMIEVFGIFKKTNVLVMPKGGGLEVKIHELIILKEKGLLQKKTPNHESLLIDDIIILFDLRIAAVAAAAAADR